MAFILAANIMLIIIKSLRLNAVLYQWTFYLFTNKVYLFFIIAVVVAAAVFSHKLK